MSLPIPPVALKDHCSVVYRHTLYTFQSDAFQSLDLRPGGRWSQLPLGVSTTGSVCVQASPNGEDSMFVVGGVTNSSFSSFSGLQRYIFKSRRWQTISPQVNVTQHRLGHSSVYLNHSSTILIYAGSQDGNPIASSQTFTISAIPPYKVLAHSPQTMPPPLLKPLLIPWNNSHALLLGGDSQNKDLFTFGLESEEWQRLDDQLQTGLKNSSKVQATIFVGGDGSKTLEIFDMSASPNNITRLELQQATRQVLSGTTKSSTSSSSSARTENSSRKRKRETSERPAYNSTLAPKTPRDGFSLARDPDGLVVVSGGEPEKSNEIICLFNQTGNTWIEESQFFATSTSSASPTPSTTATSIIDATQTPAPPGPTSTGSYLATDSKARPLTILGATLGAVFGFVALVIIILLLLRCRRRRKEGVHKRNNSDYPSDGKREMNYGDRDVGYTQDVSGIAAGHAGHKHMDSGQSTTSLAIMTGRAGAASSQSKRGFLHKPGGSNGSSKSFFSRARSPLAPSPPLISGPIPVEDPRNDVPIQTTPEPRTEPRTDTGWSRYFANNSSTNLSNVPPGSPNHEPGSRPTTYTSGSQSDYVSSRIASSDPHESAEVPPLSVRNNAPYPPNTRLVSPTSGLPLALQPGIAFSSGASLHDPSTPSTLNSQINEEDRYRQEEDHSHGSEGMESWTPIASSERGSTWEERPISSIYTDSVIYPHPGERVRIPNFPRVPSTTRNSTGRNSQVESLGDSRGMRNVAARDQRSSPFSDQDRELPEVGVRRVGPQTPGDERGAVAGPSRDGDAIPGSRIAGVDDMSWLNLGR